MLHHAHFSTRNPRPLGPQHGLRSGDASTNTVRALHRQKILAVHTHAPLSYRPRTHLRISAAASAKLRHVYCKPPLSSHSHTAPRTALQAIKTETDGARISSTTIATSAVLSQRC